LALTAEEEELRCTERLCRGSGERPTGSSYDGTVDARYVAQPEASPAWARFYNEVGSRFAVSVAPRIRAYYEATAVRPAKKTLLDVCCGTGQLARHFLDHAYEVTGLDHSEAMLDYARLNAGSHVADGTARFIRADAADFHVGGEFGLATSTFDALNLLQSTEALHHCFRCVRSVVTDSGLFIFDLMTQRGFWQDYNGQWVDDTPRYLYVYRSIYDGRQKAQSRMVGFLRTEDGQSERFDEHRTPTFFSATEVTDMLHETGWTTVTVAATEDLDKRVDDPETLDRVFFIAQR
jgi:ubiquinone/menaquinone biosynthesis C-methylase UbiE